MDELAVRIVNLEPMRVASFHGFGPSPEHLAIQKLADWAAPRGYLVDRKQHRIFGFNNPNPSHGSPNYGYELWLVVGRRSSRRPRFPSGSLRAAVRGRTMPGRRDHYRDLAAACWVAHQQQIRARGSSMAGGTPQ